MKIIDLKKYLKDRIIFSINDIKKLEPAFHKQRLSDWQKKDYIQKLIKGKYFFSEEEIDENVLFYFSNKIYQPSYVSLESALSFYNLIPEAVYQVTSVSTKRTYMFNTLQGSFSFRQIKKELFWGYTNIKFNNHSFKIAEPEKAIIDFFYLNTHIENIDNFAELRIDEENFNNVIDKNKLLEYLSFTRNVKLEIRAKKFLKFMQNAKHK